MQSPDSRTVQDLGPREIQGEPDSQVPGHRGSDSHERPRHHGGLHQCGKDWRRGRCWHSEPHQPRGGRGQRHLRPQPRGCRAQSCLRRRGHLHRDRRCDHRPDPPAESRRWPIGRRPYPTQPIRGRPRVPLHRGDEILRRPGLRHEPAAHRLCRPCFQRGAPHVRQRPVRLCSRDRPQPRLPARPEQRHCDRLVRLFLRSPIRRRHYHLSDGDGLRAGRSHPALF